MTNTGDIAVGYNSTISYIAEAIYGTIPATPTWVEIGRIQSADLVIGSEHVPIYGLDAQERIGAPQGNESYELSLEFLINDVAWTFIKLIESAAVSYSFRIENALGSTDYFTYMVGCVIDEITVSGSVGEAWSVSATVFAQQLEADEFTATPFTDEVEYTRAATIPEMTHAGVLSAGDAWTTDPTTDTNEVTDVEFTISFNHEEDRILIQNTVAGFYEGNREYSFSMTVNFDDITHPTRILDDESGQLKLEIVDATLNIAFTGCVYDELTLPMAEGEMVRLEISGTASTMVMADT